MYGYHKKLTTFYTDCVVQIYYKVNISVLHNCNKAVKFFAVVHVPQTNKRMPVLYCSSWISLVFKGPADYSTVRTFYSGCIHGMHACMHSVHTCVQACVRACGVRVWTSSLRWWTVEFSKQGRQGEGVNFCELYPDAHVHFGVGSDDLLQYSVVRVGLEF